MKEKILISDKVNMTALDDFLNLVVTVRDEFNMQTIALKKTSEDDRNVYAKFTTRFGLMTIDYDYYNDKIYLDVICNNKDIEIVEQLKNRIKEIIDLQVEARF